MVEIESFLAPSVAPTPAKADEDAPPLQMQYFCITGNDKLLGYWGTVADRLFKIRHCMNIEGIERSLPIFEPEIDPGLLVRAAAAGIDISSALNDINAAVPHYRFSVMVQKAAELCNDVKALGGAFLSALEKRDAEALALLRSSQEVELLEGIRKIKAQQIDEANNTLEGLRKYEDVVTTRQQYYQSRPFINPFEIGHLGLTANSLIPMSAQLGAEVTAAIMHLIPDIKTGAPTSIGATYGGGNLGSGVQAFGSAAGITASMLNTAASLSSTLGGYQRRQDDWTHQADLATKELQQVKKQIIAAEIRLAISEQELQNQYRSA